MDLSIEVTVLLTIIVGLFSIIMLLLIELSLLKKKNELLHQTIKYFNVGEDLDFEEEEDVDFYAEFDDAEEPLEEKTNNQKKLGK